MMPNLSGRNRAARLFTSAAFIFVGVALWPDAPDLFCLLGATTFMTAIIGWCPLVEPSWEAGRLAVAIANIDALPPEEPGINRPGAGPQQSQSGANGRQEDVGGRVSRLGNAVP
jgi:hypothetical protein